jgi:anti-sigma factor RsiW
MDKDREIMHKILDNEADDAERAFVDRSMETDPELREEASGLMRAVKALETSKRHDAPMAFTAEVMRKLPEKKPSPAAGIREFLFGSRVLRWNMATALATAAVLLITILSLSGIPRWTAMHAARPADGVVTVRLTFYSPQAQSVAVAGDFNKWKTDSDEMKGTDGMWSVDLQLKPGVYAYSFVIDGRSWVPDPAATTFKDDGLGSRNAVLRVDI